MWLVSAERNDCAEAVAHAKEFNHCEAIASHAKCDFSIFFGRMKLLNDPHFPGKSTLFSQFFFRGLIICRAYGSSHVDTVEGKTSSPVCVEPRSQAKFWSS